MNNEQHREDTKYVQWGDGMYVMLDDLLCDYEKALIEDSLRGSVYFKGSEFFFDCGEDDGVDCMGVYASHSGYWDAGGNNVKLTRAQALYIATGDTDI
jgi:hypothetical protein